MLTFILVNFFSLWRYQTMGNPSLPALDCSVVSILYTFGSPSIRDRQYPANGKNMVLSCPVSTEKYRNLLGFDQKRVYSVSLRC